MKAFNQVNFEKFISEQDDVAKGEEFGTDRDFAQDVFNRFLEWLARPDEPQIALPVRQRKGALLIIEDATGRQVAEAPMIELVEPLIKRLNVGHRPNSDDTDERPIDERSADERSADERPAHKRSIPDPDEDEDWNEDPNWREKVRANLSKTGASTAGRRTRKAVAKSGKPRGRK
jgi:hypothetical protein